MDAPPATRSKADSVSRRHDDAGALSHANEGAVIVQAAIAMVVLLGFSAFVVDYGVLWLSREQAQNAADAGAIAGAIARAYDDLDPAPSAALASLSRAPR